MSSKPAYGTHQFGSTARPFLPSHGFQNRRSHAARQNFCFTTLRQYKNLNQSIDVFRI